MVYFGQDRVRWVGVTSWYGYRRATHPRVISEGEKFDVYNVLFLFLNAFCRSIIYQVYFAIAVLFFKLIICSESTSFINHQAWSIALKPRRHACFPSIVRHMLAPRHITP